MKRQYVGLAVLTFATIGTFAALVLGRRSELLIDPYWRYQGIEWSNLITQSAHLNTNPFTQQTLSVVSNSFYPNTVAPLLVAMEGEVTGVSNSSLYKLPLFMFPIIVTQSLIAIRLFKESRFTVFAAGLAIALPYFYYNFDYAPHRISMSFLFFYTIVLLSIIFVQTRDRKALGLTAFCSLFFVSLYWTIALSAVVFFVFFFSLTDMKRHALRNLGITYFLAATLYYLFLSGFLDIPLQTFISSFPADNFLSLLTFQSVLPAYLLGPSPLPWWYHLLGTVSRILVYVALSFCCLLASVRVVRRRALNVIDALSLASGALVLSAVILQSALHVVSGGISSDFLVYLMTPISVTYSLQAILKWQNIFAGVPFLGVVFSRRTALARYLVAVGLCASVILASAYTLVYVSDSRTTFSNVSSSSVATASWIAAFSHGKIVMSDFNFLSTYVSIAGDVPTYSIRPYVAGGTASSFDVSQMNAGYYLNPLGLSNVSDIYVVTAQMRSLGIFTDSGVWTRPNPLLVDQLSLRADLVFANGQDCAAYFIKSS